MTTTDDNGDLLRQELVAIVDDDSNISVRVCVCVCQCACVKVLPSGPSSVARGGVRHLKK